MSTTIKVSDEQARRLRAIAIAHGLTISGLIDRFVRQEIEAGTISAEIPGLSVEPDFDSGLSIRFANFWFQNVPAHLARQIADVLDEVAEGGTSGKALTYGRDTLKLARIGRGVVMAGEELDMPVMKKSVTPELAHEFAAQIRAEADKISQ